MVCERDQKPAIRVELQVNGREIELNGFVQDFIGGAILGMVGPLRGVDDVRTATLSISRPAE